MVASSVLLGCLVRVVDAVVGLAVGRNVIAGGDAHVSAEARGEAGQLQLLSLFVTCVALAQRTYLP
jgi:hypothetical protein